MARWSHGPSHGGYVEVCGPSTPVHGQRRHQRHQRENFTNARVGRPISLRRKCSGDDAKRFAMGAAASNRRWFISGVSPRRKDHWPAVGHGVVLPCGFVVLTF